MNSKKKLLLIEPAKLDVIQDLIWTSGKVVDAIRNTSGIEEISQTIIRDESNIQGSIKAFLIEVRPKSSISVGRLARILKRKIIAAQKKHLFEYDKAWHAFVFTDFLDSTTKMGGGIGTDSWDRHVIKIKISPYGLE